MIMSKIGILLESIGPCIPHPCLIILLIHYCNICIMKSLDENK